MGGCFSVSVSCELQKAMGALKAKRNDVQGRVDREEFTGHRRRLDQVQVWLTSILTMETQVNDFLSTSDVEIKRLCLCRFCSKNVKKSYLYGKRVMVMLREVESLSSQGEFDAVTDETPIAEGEELPIQHTIVGQETMLEMVWNLGKTTLLTQINNRFSKRGGGFDVVIWVVVSQNATVHKIQGSIGEKLGLGGKEWDEKSEMKRGQDIHNVLRKKKFVLFLDDIWEKVSLDVIGVPYPNRVNGCKVAFTTRSREVCGRMGVDDPIEVCCLHTDKAWDLFKKKVGENTLGSHPDIPELARKVAGKCRGLPLALNVIGETMASKRSVQEWHRAIQVLTSYAAEFSGVEDEILPILKYSYDSLDEELIEYWIGEGFTDEKEGREMALNQGYEILETLVRAFLLLEDNPNVVKMHDVVREMAMWIPSDLGKNKEICIVQAGARIRELPKVKNWKDVRRISLMENDIQTISESPECPELTTLLLQRNYLVEISDGFFQSMQRLLVLDLSWNDLSGFQMDVSNLWTSSLESLEGISGLSSLRTLKLQYSKVRLDRSLMKELQLLQHIEYVSVSISSSTLVGETLFDDPRMGRCIQQVWIGEKEPVKVLVLPALDGLHDIFIQFCRMLEEIKIEKTPWNKSLTSPCFSNLTQVEILSCNGLKDLTWLLFAPKLTHLRVAGSVQLENIISKEKAESVLEDYIIPFHKLEVLVLDDLPELKSIYWNALPFQRLRWLHILNGCPKLRKLPLNSKSVVNVEKLVIECRHDKEWLERVEWEDEATRLRFLPSCKEA
ncbi:BnaC08g40550D [Brassica napus]|uniref:BnaC08g40550D protein n=1 Tax=Brassica napus TaxID=3708 RepID=A0A078FUM1_BRANA|nr:BnaC08g40550D [Brassica napus]